MKKDERRMTYVLLGVACLLLVLSLGQAYQIDALEEKMDGQTGGTPPPVATAGNDVQAPAREPVMVGGC